MAKVGDIVFAKTHDVYTGEDTVSPAIVTRVFTAEDGDWAKDREILGLTVLGHDRAPVFIDMDKRSDDEFQSGSWSDSTDEDSVTATENNEPVTDSTAEPVTTPSAETQTVGDGTESAPVSQPAFSPFG
jgi:hypothetical protein